MSDHRPRDDRRNTRIVMGIVAALVMIVAVFAALNAGSIGQKRALQDAAIFQILAGERVIEVSMEDVRSLSPVEVRANYKKNNRDPEARTYTGVPLADILEAKAVDAAAYASVAFTAADGYASAVPISDALNRESCFIVIAENGEPLGKKESGGSGPFMMILAQDPFSQRWCKFLLEVRLQ